MLNRKTDKKGEAIIFPVVNVRDYVKTDWKDYRDRILGKTK